MFVGGIIVLFTLFFPFFTNSLIIAGSAIFLRGELSNSQESYALLSHVNGRLAGDLTKAKEEPEESRRDALDLRAQVIKSQGPLLRAFLYKLKRTNVFGEHINWCREVINHLVTIDAIELITMDHPILDIKKPDYGYDKHTREQVNWHLAEEMLKALEFPLLKSLKTANHILAEDEVLKSAVDEYLMFRKLDKTGHISPLGPPLSSPRLSLIVAIPQTLPELETPASNDLPEAENVV